MVVLLVLHKKISRIRVPVSREPRRTFSLLKAMAVDLQYGYDSTTSKFCISQISIKARYFDAPIILDKIGVRPSAGDLDFCPIIAVQLTQYELSSPIYISVSSL